MPAVRGEVGKEVKVGIKEQEDETTVGIHRKNSCK
jgi:hypothetical protein